MKPHNRYYNLSTEFSTVTHYITELLKNAMCLFTLEHITLNTAGSNKSLICWLYSVHVSKIFA